MIRSLTHAHVMNPAVHDTTPLIRILDEDVDTGPPTQGSFPAGTPGNGVPKDILTVGTAFPGIR